MVAAFAEVIGDPVKQSKSPLIHNFWLGELGIDAEYHATHIKTGELLAYLTDRREDPAWHGCNVTMPHKQAIMPFLDEIDPLAQRIGAVNTVISREGRLCGYNTDVQGFLEPLRSHLEQTHLFRMARIIGTGGAARAIIAALADAGFTLVVAGRDMGKASALLDELAPAGEHHTAPLDYFAERMEFPFDDRKGCLDLIVNASLLGMRGQPALRFDWSHAPPGSIAYDIVTDPVETEFLKGAEAEGLPTINGLAMLVGQAAQAFTLFFGQSAPRDRDRVLWQQLAI